MIYPEQRLRFQKRSIPWKRIFQISIPVLAAIVVVLIVFVVHSKSTAASTDKGSSGDATSVASPSEDLGALWDKNSYDLVMKAATARIDSNPSDFFARLYRGLAGFFVGYAKENFEEADAVFAQAIGDLRIALVLEPFRNNGDIHYMLGKLYYRREYYYQDLARKHLLIAAKESYNAPDLFEYLGLLNADLGDQHAAIQYLTDAWNRSKSDEVLLAIAKAYVNLEQYDKAFENVNALIARSKDPMIVLKGSFIRADILLKQNHIDLAISEYLSILKGNPQSADAHFYLGEAYHAQGDLVKARAEWREAYNIDPKHLGAVARLNS